MIKNSKAVKIISYLMENPSAKVAEVAAKNNVSKSYAHKIMTIIQCAIPQTRSQRNPSRWISLQRHARTALGCARSLDDPR
jgi:DNA-binding IclR family transcriptional regulator